jgi:hypothetical protein
MVRPGTRTVRFPLTNRAYIFLTPANRPVSPDYRPVFLTVETGPVVDRETLPPTTPSAAATASHDLVRGVAGGDWEAAEQASCFRLGTWESDDGLMGFLGHDTR